MSNYLQNLCAALLFQQDAKEGGSGLHKATSKSYWDSSTSDSLLTNQGAHPSPEVTSCPCISIPPASRGWKCKMLRAPEVGSRPGREGQLRAGTTTAPPEPLWSREKEHQGKHILGERFLSGN